MAHAHDHHHSGAEQNNGIVIPRPTPADLGLKEKSTTMKKLMAVASVGGSVYLFERLWKASKGGYVRGYFYGGLAAAGLMLNGARHMWNGDFQLGLWWNEVGLGLVAQGYYLNKYIASKQFPWWHKVPTIRLMFVVPLTWFPIAYGLNAIYKGSTPQND